MQAKLLFVMACFAATTGISAEAARRIHLVAEVPLVAQVETPAAFELAPGETRSLTVRVACNQPWLLVVLAGNPLVHTAGRHAGPAGGMAAAGNTFTVTVSCDPAATGPQKVALATQLVSGPLVAGLAY